MFKYLKFVFFDKTCLLTEKSLLIHVTVSFILFGYTRESNLNSEAIFSIISIYFREINCFKAQV